MRETRRIVLLFQTTDVGNLPRKSFNFCRIINFIVQWWTEKASENLETFSCFSSSSTVEWNEREESPKLLDACFIGGSRPRRVDPHFRVCLLHFYFVNKLIKQRESQWVSQYFDFSNLLVFPSTASRLFWFDPCNRTFWMSDFLPSTPKTSEDAKKRSFSILLNILHHSQS